MVESRGADQRDAKNQMDALELGMGLSRKYDFKIDPKDPEAREAFQNVRSLAAFVADRRQPVEEAR